MSVPIVIPWQKWTGNGRGEDWKRKEQQLGEKGWEMVKKGGVLTSLSSSSHERFRGVVVHRVYYSTFMSFHQIRSKEQAKIKTVIHCSVLI